MTIRYVQVYRVLMFVLMAERMNDKLVQTKYATDIGSTYAANPQDSKVCELFGAELDDPAYQEFWYTPQNISNPQGGVSDAHESRSKGVNKEHLQKIWRIIEDEAMRNLEVTKQLNKQDGNSNLSRAFSSNDRMLR